MTSQQVRRPGQQRMPRPPADPNTRRRGAVYCILTRPVDREGMPIPGAAPEVGYIGKSRQTVWQREQQHRDNQPFSDLIVGGSFTLEEGMWTEAELDAREQWWIRHGAAVFPGGPVQRPRYNHDWNLDNPERIEIWRAREQRLRRDPSWQPAQVRVPRQRAAATGGRPVRARLRRRVRWTRRRVRAVALVVLWLALFTAAWRSGWDVWPGWDGPRNAAIAATGVMGAGWWAWLRARPKKRRRRRRR